MGGGATSPHGFASKSDSSMTMDSLKSNPAITRIANYADRKLYLPFIS